MLPDIDKRKNKRIHLKNYLKNYKWYSLIFNKRVNEKSLPIA